jgi:hypothetical protein
MGGSDFSVKITCEGKLVAEYEGESGADIGVGSDDWVSVAEDVGE